MFNMGVGKGITITPFFTSYTSPNGSFGTVNEFAFKVAHASKFAPYGIVAFELSGQADGGSDEGHLRRDRHGAELAAGRQRRDAGHSA